MNNSHVIEFEMMMFYKGQCEAMEQRIKFLEEAYQAELTRRDQLRRALTSAYDAMDRLEEQLNLAEGTIQHAMEYGHPVTRADLRQARQEEELLQEVEFQNEDLQYLLDLLETDDEEDTDSE